MANQEHLQRLKHTPNWNSWRKENPTILPDLSGADLSRANLSDANLISANLIDADLSFADLSFANLTGADLSFANLSHADLSNTDLSFANLNDANLSFANLSHAYMFGTSLGDRDLRIIKGLETVQHIGPSPLSINTFYLSQGDIPEAFVRGTGASDSFLDYMKSLARKPIEYYTCFISYSSQDSAFANYLHADLQQQHVRCWFAPENLKIGDRFWHRIDESIRLYDKLLVILSQHSINSSWVEQEVMAALEKEQQQNKTVLFPIKLDEAVMQTSLPWAASIRRSRHIGDFTLWKDHDHYQQAFTRLLRDLKAETKPAQEP